MTKDELYRLVESFIYDGGLNYRFHEIIDGLDEFFSQNVVIPKGENRHPYADIIHQKLEDMSLKLEVKQDRARYAGWVTHIGLDFMEDEYRIKPEPVYEYQYAVVNSVSESARLEWLTPIESVAKYGNNAYVIEETKRERK